MDKREKIKIGTLILSDTHLGDNTSRCAQIMEVLDKYKFERLVLNGDILDGLSFGRLHTQHWQILSKLRRLSRKYEVIWIHGNHDAAINILSRLLGIRVHKKFIWQDGGKRFLALHGHQFDRFMHNNAIISYLAFMFYYLIKRLDISGVLPKYIRQHNQTWKRNAEEVAKGAMRLGRNLGVDCVFCGHTHLIDQKESGGIEYFNTGCWVEKPSAFATINNGDVDLVKVE